MALVRASSLRTGVHARGGQAQSASAEQNSAPEHHLKLEESLHPRVFEQFCAPPPRPSPGEPSSENAPPGNCRADASGEYSIISHYAPETRWGWSVNQSPAEWNRRWCISIENWGSDVFHTRECVGDGPGRSPWGQEVGRLRPENT